jgi:hypothetical protein
MSEKWTLTEGIEKLLPENPEEAEISDLGTPRRQLTLDISIAEGRGEDGTPGISVILSLPADYTMPPGEEQDTRSQSYFWDFSCLMVPAEGETMQGLVARIAKELGIKPDERVWEDGEQME